MRDAHKARALPNKKLPRGIERQDELLELIEKRFHQEDLIRTALNKKDEANAEAIAEANADERTSSADASDAPSADAGDAPSADTSDAPSAVESSRKDETATADNALSADAGDLADEIASNASDIAETVTIRWHGQNETITDPRTWLTVFDTVRKAGDVITREVADRRFHGESYWKTCDALYLSTGTYYHHVRAILHYAFACAVYHRLIDPRPKHSFSKAM